MQLSDTSVTFFLLCECGNSVRMRLKVISIRLITDVCCLCLSVFKVKTMFSKTVRGFSLAAMMLVGFSASATTISLESEPNNTFAKADFIGTVSPINDLVAVGSFPNASADFFSFTVGANSNVSVSFQEAFNGRPRQFSQHLSPVLTVFDSSKFAIANSFAATAGSTYFARLAGGQFSTYALHVTAAVPEPETYAMMLAGLGLVGAIARRKKQSAQEAVAA